MKKNTRKRVYRKTILPEPYKISPLALGRRAGALGVSDDGRVQFLIGFLSKIRQQKAPRVPGYADTVATLGLQMGRVLLHEEVAALAFLYGIFQALSESPLQTPNGGLQP